MIYLFNCLFALHYWISRRIREIHRHCLDGCLDVPFADPEDYLKHMKCSYWKYIRICDLLSRVEPFTLAHIYIIHIDKLQADTVYDPWGLPKENAFWFSLKYVNYVKRKTDVPA